MAPQSRPNCPTCGSRTEYAFDLPERTVVKCTNPRCTLHFCHPQPDDDALTALYQADFAPGARPGHGSTPPAYARTLVRALSGATGTLAGRRVLDFGAGIGNVSAALREAGADVVAVEPSPEGRARTMAQAGILAVAGLSELGPRVFSLIVMVEVIEHLRNPRAVLETLRTMVEADGQLFVTTPNLASLRARLEGPAWPNVATPHHLFYFTKRSLDHTLRAAGFDRIAPVPGAGRHHELPLSRQVVQAALRPFGLDGGLQVLASPGASPPGGARDGSTR